MDSDTSSEEASSEASPLPLPTPPRIVSRPLKILPQHSSSSEDEIPALITKSPKKPVAAKSSKPSTTPPPKTRSKQLLLDFATEVSPPSTSPKKQKRSSGLVYSKRSVAHYFFEGCTGPGGEVGFRCKLSSYVSAPNHQEFFKTFKTSNAILHLRSFHAEDLDAMERAKGQGLNLTITFNNLISSRKIPKGNLEKYLIKPIHLTTKDGKLLISGRLEKDLALVVWMVDQQLSFHAFDSPHWKIYNNSCGTAVSSSDSLDHVLTILYNVALKDSERELQLCEGFSTTMDLWTAPGPSPDHFLSLTYHWIAVSQSASGQRLWFRKKRLLDLMNFLGQAFAYSLLACSKGRIQQHTRPENLHVSSSTDRGANIYLASKDLVGVDNANPCFNHALHHIIQSTFGSKGTIGDAKQASMDLLFMWALVKVINAHGVLRSKFLLKSKDLNLLEDDFEIRWYSLFRAVERCSRLKEQIAEFTSLKPAWYLGILKDLGASAPTDPLSDSYWNRFFSYRDLLQSCNIMSLQAQSFNDGTASNIPFWIYQLLSLCESDPSRDTVTVRATKDALSHNVQHYAVSFYMKQTSLALKAALLDPRHTAHVPLYLKSCGLSKTSVRNLLICCWDSIVDDALESPETIDLAPSAEQAEYRTTMLPLQKQVLVASLPLLQFQLQNASPPLTIKLLSQLDPLLWWSKNELIVFHPAAQMLLSIPSGGSPSEAVFSSAAGFVTKKRTLLSVEHLEQMTVIRDWLHSTNFTFPHLLQLVQDEIDVLNNKTLLDLS